MTDLEMLKSLTRTLEILAEENKELRNEIKQLRGITYVLSDEAKSKLEEFFGEEACI